jgi:hypothetical protein
MVRQSRPGILWRMMGLRQDARMKRDGVPPRPVRLEDGRIWTSVRQMLWIQLARPALLVVSLMMTVDGSFVVLGTPVITPMPSAFQFLAFLAMAALGWTGLWWLYRTWRGNQNR